jgi:hypothetical protein
MNDDKVDMSPAAITARWRRVGELARACRALAGDRRHTAGTVSAHTEDNTLRENDLAQQGHELRPKSSE